MLHTFTVTESGGDGGGGAKGVEGVKQAVATLSRLVDHSPVHWSSVLLKVCVCLCVCVFVCVCVCVCVCDALQSAKTHALCPTPSQWLLAVLKEVTATKRAPSASIDSSVKFWVANTVTQPLCALLRTCVDVLSVATPIVLHPTVIPSLSPPPPPCRLPLDVSSAVALPLEQLLGQSTHSEWIFAYLMCVQS